MDDLHKFLLWECIFSSICFLAALIIHKNFLAIKEDVLEMYRSMPSLNSRDSLLDSYKNVRDGRNFFIFLAVVPLLAVLIIKKIYL